MICLGLNLVLKKVGENAQVLWNDGGQDGVEPPTPAFSDCKYLEVPPSRVSH